MRSLALLALLLLAACKSSGGGSPAPAPDPNWQPSTQAIAWSVIYSRNAPAPAQQGAYIVFGIPANPGDIDYTVTAAKPLAGKSITLTADVVIPLGGSIRQSDDGANCAAPAAARILIRRGTDLTFSQNRWWSVQTFPLTAGVHTMTIPLEGVTGGQPNWSSVSAETPLTHSAQFEATKAGATTIGVTFGGCFAGHGVYGPATFILRELRINR